MTSWEIQGRELASCNCSYGCPCQFSVAPTDGTCEAIGFCEISKGHYGSVKLDGLRFACMYKWPGAIHEGNGEMQLVIDERANAEQREALEAILTGKDTDEMATMWYVFAAMSPNRHQTLFAPIELTIDVGKATGHGKATGIAEVACRPIPNIVTGEPHRISIRLPGGFEFSDAEFASGTAKTTGGAMKLTKNVDSHAHLAHLHLNGKGVVRKTPKAA